MNILSKIALTPFAAIYAGIIFLRNYLYNKHFFRSVKFDIPVINVGNLSTGGTGKTPHIDYLINTLKEQYPVGVLSRGYKRKTSGYLNINPNHKATEAGDEPLLLKWKHPEIPIAVSESRALGIPKLAFDKGNDFVVLLDDAFQHRAVRAGLNILLTPYDDLYTDSAILPLGNLREFKSGAKRADIIIVSKTPKAINEEEKKAIIKKINPESYQFVLFSHIEYKSIYAIENNELKNIEFEKDSAIILVSGIANTSQLISYLEGKYNAVFERKFADHHHYSTQDIESIISTYKNVEASKKYLLTTEKDLTRLIPFIKEFNKNGIHIHCLPISVNFAPKEQEKFNKLVAFYIDKTVEDYFKD